MTQAGDAAVLEVGISDAGWPRVDGGRPRPGPLERMAQLYRSNERLTADLGDSCERIERARAYLDAPGSNRRFGSAHLDRCRRKHSTILAGLRANRIEAIALLRSVGGPA